MENQRTTDTAATVRHTRFGTLPERIRYEDMVEEQPVGPQDPARDRYNPERSWLFSSCLATDLGL
ncbi:hypothetical protein ACIQGZ_28325 [Streptomyces sp. NPDC092296]|uniref:hypothetical protein n=1 Tax=Streptomyces sp. NPDC092296 TaxID=3366012 RepID=UPI0037FF191A